jgi:hypothetical protein
LDAPLRLPTMISNDKEALGKPDFVIPAKAGIQ